MEYKDFREIFYRIYEENLEIVPVPELAISSGKVPVVEGGIYFTILNRPIFFIVIREIGQYYECLKMSNFYELSNHYDVFYRMNLDSQLFSILTDINFYLSKEEIENSVLLEVVDQQFLTELIKFRELDDEQKLKQVRLETGFYYPYGNKYVTKFKEREFEIVKDYHLRIFQILDEMEEEELNVVKTPSERLVEYRTHIPWEKCTALGENFILYREQDYDIINIIVPKEYIGKRIKITHKSDVIFDKVVDDNVVALLIEDSRRMNLDKIAKDVEVEAK